MRTPPRMPERPTPEARADRQHDPRGRPYICRIYDVDGATLEQYDEVDQKFPGMPDGGRCHIAGMLDGRLQVIEVWDSRE